MKSFNKLILLIVCGFGISVAILLWVLRPGLTRINELYINASDKKTDLQTLADQITAYKSAKSDLGVVEDKDKILNSILERDNLQIAIEEVEAAAAKAGVETNLVIHETFDKAGKPISAKPIITGNKEVDEVTYDINFKGTFISLIKFLEYLEHLPHFTEIYEVNLSYMSEGSNPEGVSLHSDTINGTLRAVFMVRKAGIK